MKPMKIDMTKGGREPVLIDPAIRAAQRQAELITRKANRARHKERWTQRRRANKQRTEIFHFMGRIPKGQVLHDS